MTGKIPEKLLFDQSLARSSDPLSSFIAGERARRSRKCQNLLQMILRAVRSHPGLTSAEIGKLLEIDRHDAARRLPHLMHRGVIIQGKQRICRVCGSRCVTWWLAENGRRF